MLEQSFVNRAELLHAEIAEINGLDRQRRLISFRRRTEDEPTQYIGERGVAYPPALQLGITRGIEEAAVVARHQVLAVLAFIGAVDGIAKLADVFEQARPSVAVVIGKILQCAG